MRHWALTTFAIRLEQDVVTARQRAKQVAQRLGFDSQAQTRFATAVSELARNAFIYAGSGKIEFVLEDSLPEQTLLVRVSDSGPGIADLDAVLEGSAPHASSRPGLGLVAARKLVDSFHIDSRPGEGTVVTVRIARPTGVPPMHPQAVQQAVDDLARSQPRTAMEELRQQNQELLTTLEALEQNQQELVRLNRELEDTNRGVVALYAELDEKAKELHRANQIKSRFLAHMSHEFRTPLNSVLALSRLLLDHADGELGDEQTKQVIFIRRAAGELLDMVNDLLDLAKVEAGTMTVDDTDVDVEELLSTLRGMFMPLVTNPDVRLVFESAEHLPRVRLDERKTTQILRNFIGNALKFTPSGEVRVEADLDVEASRLTFRVSDTGIGISRVDQVNVFEEFKQVSNSVEQKTLGSGLGLAIAKRLAEVIGGAVGVSSEPGRGSTFYLQMPLKLGDGYDRLDGTSSELGDAVLIIDDNEIDRYILKGLISESGYRLMEASDGDEGLRLAKSRRPKAIFLDLMMPGLNGFEVLRDLREDPELREVAVVIITSKSLSEGEASTLTGAGATLLPKAEYSLGDAGARARTALRRALQNQGERSAHER